ncbi:tRNA (uridine(54)-C5)-methyltransferase TrmA [Porticoccaceae bacterium]|nr:tRNA (uridine(54)-C5)-methyltransferase TrmA [Porticoccaceae bacterium]MDA9014500.1 tRNA (uridine(54)-C5)-methyltransferase TrmA [Porticoccaceae bacterium]
MNSDSLEVQSDYQQQLSDKIDRYKALMADAGISLPELEIHDSAPFGFRMRAEFRVWHENGQAHYAMNKPGEKRPFIIQDFPIGSALINQLMPQIMVAVNKSDTLSYKLFSMEYLTTTTGEALITLIYHRQLDDQWQQVAEQLQSTFNIKVIGRSRKQKVVLCDDFVTETLEVNQRQYSYQQVEASFTQPNAQVNQKMLTWAANCLSEISGDLVELYCGNGNFTAVLAQYFDKVLATEISKVSVNSANTNFAANKIDNVTIARLSSEEFTQALIRERAFRRLADIDLDSFNFSTIFVDPPRAGLDAGTERLVTQMDNILYISCNPDTLAENLKHITKTHKVVKAALFDQFPWTHHIESGVYLQRI